MATMSRQEAHAFLDSRPGWIVLSTVGRDGYPHSVPLGYFRRGDDIYLTARGKSQRRVNIQHNPRVCLLLESGSQMRELRGLVVRGDAALVTDPAEVLELTREAARQRGTPEGELPAAVRPGTAYIRVTPRSTISWDNSRDG